MEKKEEFNNKYNNTAAALGRYVKIVSSGLNEELRQKQVNGEQVQNESAKKIKITVETAKALNRLFLKVTPDSEKRAYYLNPNNKEKIDEFVHLVVEAKNNNPNLTSEEIRSKIESDYNNNPQDPRLQKINQISKFLTDEKIDQQNPSPYIFE